MPNVSEELRFRFVPTEVQFGVERAAAYEGHAQAMIVNLQGRNGDRLKTDVWSAEHEAWLQRKTELIDTAPLQRKQLSDYAAKIVYANFTLNVYSR